MEKDAIPLTIFVDKKSPALIDLDIFLNSLFKTELQRKVAKTIIECTSKKGESYLMTDIIPFIEEKMGKVNRVVISYVWKKLIGGGLLTRGKRNTPVKLDTKFSEKLVELANYWKNYVDYSKKNV